MQHLWSVHFYHNYCLSVNLTFSLLHLKYLKYSYRVMKHYIYSASIQYRCYVGHIIGIQQNNDLIRVTASTFLRLEKIFVIFGDHCQKSSEFCTLLAHSGIINQLMDGLFILYALQVHHTMDNEWVSNALIVILQLAEFNPVLLFLCM